MHPHQLSCLARLCERAERQYRWACLESVPYQDLASVISALGLWTRLGRAIGRAVAGGVWTSHIQADMRAEIPSPYNQNSTLINSLYGSIRTVRTKYPDLDDPVRQVIIRAYAKTVFPLFLAPLVLSIVTLIAGMLMPNCHLGKTHNTADETDTGGGRVLEDDGVGRVERERRAEADGKGLPWWKKAFGITA